MTQRPLLLLVLCLLISSCKDEIVDPPFRYYDHERITSIDWLPGDSLIAVLVTIAQADSLSSVFRIYDLQRKVQVQFPLGSSFAGSLHVSKNGRRAIAETNGGIVLIDIQNRSSSSVFPSSRFISFAPDRDAFAVFRNMDNPTFGGPYTIYTLAQIAGDTITITSTANILTGFAFGLPFPLMLSGGRMAFQEVDSLNIDIMTIRDTSLRVLHQFHLPSTFSPQDLIAPKNDSNFYFLSSAGINRFVASLGIIDLIHTKPSGFSGYTVTSDGIKVIYSSAAKNAILDARTGVEIVFQGLDAITDLILSHDDMKLAAVRNRSDADDELVILDIF